MRLSICFIFFLISCKVVQPTTKAKSGVKIKTAARLVTLTTGQLTVIVNQQRNTIDSLIAVVDTIKKGIVYLDTTRWNNNNGVISMKNKLYADTIVTTGTLVIKLLSSDTVGHNGSDTLIHANEKFDYKIPDTIPSPAAIFKKRT